MPNSEGNWETTARVIDPERLKFWRGIFDGDTVPVKSIVPQLAQLPGFAESQLVYELDVDALTQQQHIRLVSALSKRFGVHIRWAGHLLTEQGCPILAEHVSVASSDRRILAAIL